MFAIFVDAVETGDGSCRDSPIAVNQGTSSGYLSNTVTDSTSQGSVGCPWVIVVDGGQRINVTLFDFSVIANSNLDENRCQLYATIKVAVSEISFGCLSASLSVCLFACLAAFFFVFVSQFCGNNLHTLYLRVDLQRHGKVGGDRAPSHLRNIALTNFSSWRKFEGYEDTSAEASVAFSFISTIFSSI